MWKKIAKQELLNWRQIFLCLFLGSIFTIILAWGGGVLSQYKYPDMGTASAIVETKTDTGARITWAYGKEVLGQYSINCFPGYLAQSTPRKSLESGFPDWANQIFPEDLRRKVQERDGTMRCRVVGLPFPCLYYQEFIFYRRSNGTIPSDLVEGAIPLSLGSTPLFLPYYPIWSNLLANVLLFSALIAVVLYAAKVFFGVRDAQKRRCRCGYPYAAPICPECGKPVGEFFET